MAMWKRVSQGEEMFNKSDKKRRLLDAVALAGLAGIVAAPSIAAAQEAPADDTIVVTGYRASLQSSTNAKRNAVGITDSIFAEDIGKFPDLNIAESITRVPGIQLNRDATGEGLTVSIRGLGNSFTHVTLNGAQIEIATPGGIDGGEQNREVDLDMFPTELFTRIDVSKTPLAHQLEGGVSGVVDLHSARAFDNPGTHLTYSFQYGNNTNGDEWSPRGALIGSWTSDDGRFGALIGVAGVNLHSTITGYESIGWSNAGTGSTSNFTCTGCNTTFGGNNFFWAPSVPTNAGNNLTVGQTLDDARLLALNPGTSLQQLSDGLIPRLGRRQYQSGERNRLSGLLALQWRPTDNIEVYLDAMGGIINREYERTHVEWFGRNSNFMVPTNVRVDATNVVTSGVFANSAFFVEERYQREDGDMININPGAHITVNDWIQTDVQLNYNHSTYFREQPTVLFNTAPFSGVTVNYTNQGGDFPNIATNVDLNNPAIWSWLGMSVDGSKNFTTGLGNNGRVNVQNVKRETQVMGAHWDTTFGDEENNIRFGLAYDEAQRFISGRDNSQAWQNFVCGGGVPTAAPAGFANPNCTGSATPQFAPGTANGFTTGAVGSRVPNITSFLRPGPAGWVQVDWDAFKNATNYSSYVVTAPQTGGVSDGASTGLVDEETTGAYLEANGRADFLGHDLRFNGGGRWFQTDQSIGGPVTINGVTTFQTLATKYDAFLPSFTVAANLTDDIILRFSGSRTLTRANPSAMLPGTVFSDPSAQTATQGNPNIAPFKSNNFDVSFEWYTGGAGYVAATFFNKQITGFTVQGTTTVPFSALGLDVNQLSAPQQTAIATRGGPNAALVTVTQQVNAGGLLTLDGYELNWVQPLDMVLEGLGFTATYTSVDQKGEGAGAPVQAIGISPIIYNLTGYYEQGPFSVRATYSFQDASIISGPGQNGTSFLNSSGLSGAQLKADERFQWDLSASYKLDWLPSAPQLTLNAINITEEPFRTTFEFPNAAYNFREPGRQILIGLRGTF